MKKVLLTLVIGLTTMVGFSQVVKVVAKKRQEFEHSNKYSTPYAGENNLLTYTKGGTLHVVYTFDLDNMKMVFESFDIDGNKKFTRSFPIVKNHKTTNLVDVLVGEENEPDMLFVLGNTIEDNSYVLITNIIEGEKIKGSFYPDCEIEVID